MKKILIVEDEKIACNSLGQFLTRRGYEPVCRYTLHSASDIIISERFDIYLIDVRLPDGNGLELIPKIRGICPDAIIIILTAYATIEDAVTALKTGSDHYLIKPVDLDELLIILKREQERRSLKVENTSLKAYVSSLSGFDNLIGKSDSMLPVITRIKKLCLSDANVLITGESGTGKELAARTLHYSGMRQNNNFVAVNCAAIPVHLLESELFGYVKGAFTGAIRDHQGKFEYADGGTIFLDEIGELSQELQAKLLRVLQEKAFEKLGSNEKIQVDLRIIASTNKNLKELVERGEFREDLYWRLNVVEIHMPPLRERQEDIELLAHYFLKKFAAQQAKEAPRVSPEIMNIFRHYPWPGNIRELENVIERALALAETAEITINLLPTRLRNLENRDDAIPEAKEAQLKQMLGDFERNVILKALRAENGNRQNTAKRLGISLRTLQYKLKEHGI
jgi:DNA-binding NtrC family response regulator